MKNAITQFQFLVLLLCWAIPMTAQQKGVAINKPSLEEGLVLDVSGLDGANRLGVRFSPLSSAPQTTQAGSMYFNTTLRTYLQWTGSAWQRMSGLWDLNGSGQANYSGVVRIDGDLGISTNPERALDVSGAIRASGNLESAGINTGFVNANTRVTTPRVNSDFLNIAEDLPFDEALHMQMVGSSHFVSNTSTQATFIDRLVVRNLNNTYSQVTVFGASLSATNFSSPPASPSDKRLKARITVISSALEKVRQLNGVVYNWNNQAKDLFSGAETNNLVRGPEQSETAFQIQLAKQREKAKASYGGNETGLIAQDIQKVLPEAVVEGEDGYLRVKYGHLAGLFVEAIKEQQTIIDTQAERIRQLEEAQLRVLARLDQLEATSKKETKRAAED